MPNERSVATITHNTGADRLLPGYSREYRRETFRPVGTRQFSVSMNARSSLPIRGPNLSGWTMGGRGYGYRPVSDTSDDIATVRKILTAIGLIENTDYLINTTDNVVSLTKSAGEKIWAYLSFLMKLRNTKSALYNGLAQVRDSVSAMGLDVTTFQEEMDRANADIVMHGDASGKMLEVLGPALDQLIPEKKSQGLGILVQVVVAIASIIGLIVGGSQFFDSTAEQKKTAATSESERAYRRLVDELEANKGSWSQARQDEQLRAIDIARYAWETVTLTPVPEGWPGAMVIGAKAILYGSMIWAGYKVFRSIWQTIVLPHATTAGKKAKSFWGKAKEWDDWFELSSSNTPAIPVSTEWEEPTPSGWVSGSYPSTQAQIPTTKVKRVASKTKAKVAGKRKKP